MLFTVSASELTHYSWSWKLKFTVPVRGFNECCSLHDTGSKFISKNMIEIFNVLNKYDQNKSVALSPILFFLNFWNKWLHFKVFLGTLLIQFFYSYYWLPFFNWRCELLQFHSMNAFLIRTLSKSSALLRFRNNSGSSCSLKEILQGCG